MAKNYDTYYMGTTGLVVSKSETETDRAKKQLEDIKQTIIGQQEISKAQDLLDMKKRELLSKMPRPLSRSIDIKSLQTLGENTIQSYAAGMLQALRNLQSKEIDLSGHGVSKKGKNYSYSTGEDVENAGVELAEVKDFLQALTDMEKMFNAAAAKGEISKNAWDKIKSRFFLKRKTKDKNGQAQWLFIEMQRVLNGTATSGDMARVFNAIRGDFGNSLGALMEDIIRFMVQEDAVQQALKDRIGNEIASFAVSKSLGKGGAQRGTIRATLEGAEYKPQKDKNFKNNANIKGNRLRDAELTVTTGPDGGTITWGISAKQYNFHSGRNAHGEIKIAELSLQNFADVFSRIRGKNIEQRPQSRGQNALYGYRLLSANSEKNSPMLLYLLSHRVAEVVFGSSIGQMTGNDTAELMFINGKLMNTADVLDRGDLNVSTQGFPKNIGGGWWAPDSALNYVHSIHTAKLVTTLEFGKDYAIANFG